MVASGGAAWRPRTEIYGNIYDHLMADFVYPNGVHMSSHCRQYPQGRLRERQRTRHRHSGKRESNCHDLEAAAARTFASTSTIRSTIHTSASTSRWRIAFAATGPYINHAMTVAESTLTCIMAREAAYSGREITWDQIMDSQLDLQPKSFGYDMKMDVPPLAVPGEYKFV